MASGKLTFVKSAACPNGPPKGGVWFPVSVTVHGQDAQVYHSGVLVATIKPHFPPRAWGGVFAYNGYKNVILFRKFKTVPIIHVSKRCKRVVELPGYTKVDAAHGRWPQDGFCQVAYLRDGSTSSYQLSVDMYNFIGSGGVNYGHPGVLLNAEDQDNYDFVYFRFAAIYTLVRGKMSLFWFQTWATTWILKNLLTTSSVDGNDFGVLEILCEDGECYISWHVFVARLCNKPFTGLIIAFA